MNLIYVSPDNIKPNRDKVNMKDLDLIDFLGMYIPICNDRIPFKHKDLTPLLGDVIWDKRDFSILGNYLGEKRIWSLSKAGKKKYVLMPGVKIRDQMDLIGYVITEMGYNKNDIGNLKVFLSVDDN